MIKYIDILLYNTLVNLVKMLVFAKWKKKLSSFLSFTSFVDFFKYYFGLDKIALISHTGQFVMQSDTFIKNFGGLTSFVR